jgi:uncharacterized membrane protein YfcA
VMYLHAIGLAREQLIQAMGMLFTLSTLALAFALGSHQLLNTEQLLTSSVAVLPAVVGMLLGQRIRRAITGAVFRRLFFLSLLALGAYIIFSASRGLSV